MEGLRQRKKTVEKKDEVHQLMDHFHQVNMILLIIIVQLFYLKEKVSVVQSIQRFLNKYGFRCINELKLEEYTLHDDPGTSN